MIDGCQTCSQHAHHRKLPIVLDLDNWKIGQASRSSSQAHLDGFQELGIEQAEAPEVFLLLSVCKIPVGYVFL